MTIKNIVTMAWIDEKSHRKQSICLKILVIVAVVLFVGVNALASSLKDGVNDIINKPYGRIFSITADINDYEEEIQQYQELFAEREDIQQIFWHMYIRPAVWKNADIVSENSVNIDMVTAVAALEDYMVAGTAQVNPGEILVPKYLFDMGKYDEYTYGDGEELLGKNITLELKSTNTSETREYTYHVVGVYDNLRIQNSDFCICEADVLKLDEFYWLDGQEERIRQEMEEYDIPEEEFEMLLNTHVIGFLASPGYDTRTLRNEIEEISGKITTNFIEPAGDLTAYYEFIAYLGSMLSVLLGITAIILLAVTVLRDLRLRKGEMAYRYSCGYAREGQLCSFILEKIFLLGEAVVIGLILEEMILLGGNYIIAHIVSLYYRHIQLHINITTLMQCIGIVFGGGMLCLFTAVPGILHLKPAEALKNQEGK